MTPRTGPSVRYRTWVSAQLIEETWIDCRHQDALGLMERAAEQRHRIVAEAERQNKRWLIEIYEPWKPPHQAYARFGTDRDGMVEPEPLNQGTP